jgi:hypothetical protein
LGGQELVLLVRLANYFDGFVNVLDALYPLLKVAQHHQTRSYLNHALALDLTYDHFHRVEVLPNRVNDIVNQVLQNLSAETVVLEHANDQRVLIFVSALFVDVAQCLQEHLSELRDELYGEVTVPER